LRNPTGESNAKLILISWLTKNNSSPAPLVAFVEQTLDRSVTLLGQKRVPNRNVLRTRYNLDFINTDMPASKLVDAMKLNPSGTFCFYGPSGIGIYSNILLKPGGVCSPLGAGLSR